MARRPLASRIPVYLVEGFLESGKTTWLNTWLPEVAAKWPLPASRTMPNFVLVSGEQGFVELSPEAAACLTAWREVTDCQQLTESFWREWADQETPDAVWIEVNGTWRIEALLAQLPQDLYRLEQDLLVYPADRVMAGLSQPDSRLAEWLARADRVLITGATDRVQQRQIRQGIQAAGGVSSATRLAFWDAQRAEAPAKRWRTRLLDRRTGWVMRGALLLAFLWVLYLARAVLYLPEMSGMEQAVRQGLSAFLSLLFQMLPFLLLAALASSLIQLLVSDRTLTRWLDPRRVWSVPLALFSGFVIPICDCGLVPIVTRLVRKGTPLPLAALFYVSSTVTNPLVIASTYLAFPGQPTLYFYRLGLGWLVGVLLALGLMVLPKRVQHNLQETVQSLNCASGYLGDLSTQRFPRRAQQLTLAVLRHTAAEFMTLSRYVIWGAALTAFLQTVISPVRWQQLLKQPGVVLPFVIFALFFLALCASSNAFLARSFSVIWPTPAVLLYLVFSPLLDFKNLLLMRSGFGGRLTRGVILGCLVAFLILYVGLTQLPAAWLPRLNLLG